jgi:uncharacterized protein (TIGR04222 family)
VRSAASKTANQLRGRLEALGLLVSPSQANTVCTVSASIMLSAALFGLAKIFVGIDRQRLYRKIDKYRL